MGTRDLEGKQNGSVDEGHFSNSEICPTRTQVLLSIPLIQLPSAPPMVVLDLPSSLSIKNKFDHPDPS